MNFYPDIYLSMNDTIFWLKHMVVSQEDIMQVKQVRKRFCMHDYGGL